MKNSEFSGEIEPTPNYVIADSVVPPLGTPIIESAQYAIDIRMALSSDQNLYYEHELNFTNNNDGVARALGSAAQALAWVQYFARPELTMTHSPLALEIGQHYDVQWGLDSHKKYLRVKVACSYYKLKEYNSSSSNRLASICSLDVENASCERLFVAIFTRK